MSHLPGRLDRVDVIDELIGEGIKVFIGLFGGFPSQGKSHNQQQDNGSQVGHVLLQLFNTEKVEKNRTNYVIIKITACH